MSVVLESPLDMHLHLREGEMLKAVAPLSAAHFAGAVIMPNLVSPVDSLDKVTAYQKAIQDACGEAVFRPYMTLFFRPYSRAELLAIVQVLRKAVSTAMLDVFSDSKITGTVRTTIKMSENITVSS